MKQAARYTFSRLKPHSNGETIKPGVGWSDEGVEKFSELASEVKENRRKFGQDFNKELYKKVVLRSNAAAIAAAKAKKCQDEKNKPIPYDDLEDYDMFGYCADVDIDPVADNPVTPVV